jgi:hypothetical protein
VVLDRPRHEVGLYKLTHNLKAPGFTPCIYKVENRFQAFAFKCNLYRYCSGLIAELRMAGARIKLISDGDVEAAIATCDPDSGEAVQVEVYARLIRLASSIASADCFSLYTS